MGRDLTREPEHRDGNAQSAGSGDRAPLHLSPLREEDERANTLGLVITAAMLFVLFAAAMLFGSHGTIGPMPPHGTLVPTPDAKAMGNLLYGAQKAASCPQASFDSATGSITGVTEGCLVQDRDAASLPRPILPHPTLPHASHPHD